MKISTSQAFVNQFLVGLLVTIGFGGTVGVGTVWMRHQISVVADTNRALEQQYREVERRYAEVSAEVESAMSPDILRAQNQAMRLGLVELTQGQINPVPVDPIMRLAARANRRAFEAEGGGAGIQLNFMPVAAPSAQPATSQAIRQATQPVRSRAFASNP